MFYKNRCECFGEKSPKVKVFILMMSLFLLSLNFTYCNGANSESFPIEKKKKVEKKVKGEIEEILEEENIISLNSGEIIQRSEDFDFKVSPSMTHAVNGQAFLFSSSDNHVIMFENFSTDYFSSSLERRFLKVFLYPSSDNVNDIHPVDIGFLQSKTIPDQRYVVPAGVDLSMYSYVLIGEVRSDITDLRIVELIGIASLRVNTSTELTEFEFPIFSETKTPENFRISPDDGILNLIWDMEEGINYTIYWSNQSSVGTEGREAIYNVTSPYIHEELTNNVKYYYLLVAKDRNRFSQPTTELIERPRPARITDLRIVRTGPDAGSNMLVLRWSILPKYHYHLYWTTIAPENRETEETRGTTIFTKIPKVHEAYTANGIDYAEYEHEGLTNGHTYYYRVTAEGRDDKGKITVGDPSNEISGMPYIPQPTGLNVGLGYTEAILNWDILPDQLRRGIQYEYNIYWSRNPILSPLNSPDNNKEANVGDGPWKRSDVGGVKYYYRVTASYGDDESSPSDEIFGKSELTAPTYLKAISRNAAVDLLWESPKRSVIRGEAVSSYNLYWTTIAPRDRETEERRGTTIFTKISDIEPTPNQNKKIYYELFPFLDKAARRPAPKIKGNKYTHGGRTRGNSPSNLRNYTLYYYKITGQANDLESPFSNEVSSRPTCRNKETPIRLDPSGIAQPYNNHKVGGRGYLEKKGNPNGRLTAVLDHFWTNKTTVQVGTDNLRSAQVGIIPFDIKTLQEASIVLGFIKSYNLPGNAKQILIQRWEFPQDKNNISLSPYQAIGIGSYNLAAYKYNPIGGAIYFKVNNKSPIDTVMCGGPPS